jgi:hypothetical protein
MFGWSSLCNEVQLPIEGEHFELNEDVTKQDITCTICRSKVGESYFNLSDDSIGSTNGCLVRFNRNQDNLITQAELVCEGGLHRSLPFEMDTFTGDLTEKVDNVCTECWETYVNQQWAENAEGGELHISVNGEDGHSEYFAVRIKAGGGTPAQLVLESENNLTEMVSRNEIEFITLRPGRQITY